ncbi:hypothetical protein LINPERPRIM_LOCUS37785 [Linum perenne]
MYIQFYLHRTILPFVQLDHVAFSKYCFNPSSLIANLGWSSLVLPRPTTAVPDAVYQFYANLRLEGCVQNDKFSTFVDGHIIYVTPHLLATFVGVPSHGTSLFEEGEFPFHNFVPTFTLSTSTGETYSIQAITTSSKLPDSPKFHFSTLMFAQMVKFGNHLYEGDLPFGAFISTLLERLCVPLHLRYLEQRFIKDLRP